MSLVNIAAKPPTKCKWRGCKAPAIFAWGLCAIGDFHLCEEHDIELNRQLATALGARPVEKIMDRYRALPRRIEYVASRAKARVPS